MKKITNPSTEETAKPNKVTKMFDLESFNESYYFDFIAFKQRPCDENTVLRLGREFVDWALSNKEAIKASPFFKKKGIEREQIRRWRQRYEKFDKLYEYGIEILGDRREEGALKKIYSEKIFMYRQHAYDEEWKQSDEYHSKLKTEEFQNKLPDIIEIPVFKTPEPERTEKE